MVHANKPWRIKLDDIRADSDHLYFCGKEWCGYYTKAVGGMLTVPRDSLTLPPKSVLSTTAYVLGRGFTFEGPNIIEHGINRPDTSYYPGIPTLESMRYLAKACEEFGVEMKSPFEEIRYITASNTQLYVALTLTDYESGAVTSGLGWFNPNSGDYARIYSADLIGYTPQWIGCSGDTLHGYFTHHAAGKALESKWIGFYDGTLHEVNWKFAGVPGRVLLAMQAWGRSIAFATDSAVGLRFSDGIIKSWATDGVASRKPVQTYCAKRNASGTSMTDTVAFQTILPGHATKVYSVYGDWIQVAVRNGVEAYVDSVIWTANELRVTKDDWECEAPCFFTLRIPTQGNYLYTEVTDTPLTFIDFDRNGAKLGLLSAWARRKDFSPVLVPVSAR